MTRHLVLLLAASLSLGAPAGAQTSATIETGSVSGSIGLENQRRGMTVEERRSTLVDGGDGNLFPQGDAPTAAEARDRLLSPQAGAPSGVSSNPPRPTARPQPPKRATTNTDDRPKHAVHGAANPMIVAAPVHLALPEGTPTFATSGFASAQGPTIVPENWIWERGGWAWSETERAARLGDPLLLQAAGTTPLGWTRSGAPGPAGWLPEGAQACTAAQRIDLALKVHRLAMTPDEHTTWKKAVDTACMRSYVLR